MTLVPKTYECLVNAVEAGVSHGLNRTFKYEDKPALSLEELQARNDTITQEVLNSILEWFDIRGEPEPK